MMSRPKKTRLQKKSIYIRCEGKTESAFLKHIKDLYLKGEAGKKKRIKIEPENGGDLYSMRNSVETVKDQYDECYILLDRDRIPETINEWVSRPCLEGFLLAILGKQKPEKSKDCKDKFQKKILNILNKKQILKHFKKQIPKHFKKELLDERRNEICLLNQILKVFE